MARLGIINRSLRTSAGVTAALAMIDAVVSVNDGFVSDITDYDEIFSNCPVPCEVDDVFPLETYELRNRYPKYDHRLVSVQTRRKALHAYHNPKKGKRK